MSSTRRQKREHNRHINVLGEILSRFYEFLAQPQKPNNEDVRCSFLHYQNLWIEYCKRKELSDKMKQEFNHQVSEAWKHNQKAQV